ncbi:MAG: DUF2993 domain-containing protein [candidate division NC10 bacterium]|nr:DUF2993 domain-containing protein [candidate division NC10 bacterium]
MSFITAFLATLLVCSAAPAPPSPLKPAEALRQKYQLTPATLKRSIFKIVNEDPDGLRQTVGAVLKAYVEAPREFDVELAPTNRFDLMQGSFSWVKLSMSGGLFEKIGISHAAVELTNAVLDMGELLLADRLRLRSYRSLEFLVEVSEAELNRFVFAEAKSPSVQFPKVELKNGTIRVSAHVRSFGKVALEGAFEVVEGSKINFVPSSLRVGILPLPGFVTRALLNRVNPVADLTKLNIKVRPDLIVSRPGRLFVLTTGMKKVLEKRSK